MKTSSINTLFSRNKYKEAYKDLGDETKKIINNISLLVTGRLKNEKVKTLANLIEILNSLYFNHKKLPLKIDEILNRFETIFKIPGQAIEFFLAYTINRQHNKQRYISIENGPEEIDGKDKIDFIIKHYIEKLGISINIGNQLTLGGTFFNKENQKIINNRKKRNQLKNRGKIFNKRYEKGERINKTISSRYDYDVLSFLHINNGISGNDIHTEGDTNNNPYIKAFTKYKENDYSGDLIDWLPLKLKTRLNDIGLSIEIVLKSFINFLESGKFKERNYDIIEKDNYKIYIQYPPREKLKISDTEKAIYSLEFYITDKIFKKLNIEKYRLESRSIRFVIIKK